jgi:hypothetical protein
MTQVPAGWYPSPDSPGQLQYWDGTAWTDFRAVASAQAAQPAPAQPAQPAMQQPVAPTTVDPTQQYAATQPVAAPPVQPLQPAQPAQATAPAAAATVAAGGAASAAALAAAKKARLISFLGGAGLFVLGFLLGRIS